MEDNSYKKIIMEFFEEREIAIVDNTDLIESGAIDSMAIVEFIVFLEEKINIPIDVSSMTIENFRNIESILNLIDSSHGR